MLAMLMGPGAIAVTRDGDGDVWNGAWDEPWTPLWILVIAEDCNNNNNRNTVFGIV